MLKYLYSADLIIINVAFETLIGVTWMKYRPRLNVKASEKRTVSKIELGRGFFMSSW